MYLADIPVHNVQRVNNRDAYFFSDDDYLFLVEAQLEVSETQNN